MIERTSFGPDHKAFRDSFRRFVGKEIAPYHTAWEEQGHVDRTVWLKAGHNGCGYMWECPIARAYVDARVHRIYGGTNEIMKEVISRAMGMAGC